MTWALDEDRIAIRDGARSLFDHEADLERLRRVADASEGWDEALWTLVAGEMGFVGLMVPEVFGGVGLGPIEMALVLEEAGRRLAAIPLFETAVLATQTILALADEAQKAALLPEIAAGGVRATLADVDALGRPIAESGAVRLVREGDRFRLDGEAGFVPFAHVADRIFVAARGEAGLSVVALAADAPGLTIERLPSLDLTRPFARLVFDRVAVAAEDVLGGVVDQTDAFDRVVVAAAGLVASEQVGGIAFCLETTVDYALGRIQFGRPIGSFQAVKHELADMATALEAARSAALGAAVALAEGGEVALEACSIAKSWCSDAYRKCAGETIQLHGGIGFTWEHHAHLYFKRAWSTARWLGDADHHRERIARRLGLGDARGVSA